MKLADSNFGGRRRVADFVPAIILVMFALLFFSAEPATASGSCRNPHCYSIAQWNVPAIGDNFSINRASDYIADGADPTNPYAMYSHINSESWFVLNNGNYVEAGLRNGYDNVPGITFSGPCNCVAYNIFWADHKNVQAGNDTEYMHVVAHVSPDDSVRDNYSIVRVPDVPNAWYFFVNGSNTGKSDITGDWSGNAIQLGGELYQSTCGADGSGANTFSMYMQWENTSYQFVTPAQVSRAQIDTFCGFNGVSYGPGRWDWNKNGA